jgi:hypothetical protein
MEMAADNTASGGGEGGGAKRAPAAAPTADASDAAKTGTDASSSTPVVWRELLRELAGSALDSQSPSHRNAIMQRIRDAVMASASSNDDNDEEEDDNNTDGEAGMQVRSLLAREWKGALFVSCCCCRACLRRIQLRWCSLAHSYCVCPVSAGSSLIFNQAVEHYH